MRPFSAIKGIENMIVQGFVIAFFGLILTCLGYVAIQFLFEIRNTLKDISRKLSLIEERLLDIRMKVRSISCTLDLIGAEDIRRADERFSKRKLLTESKTESK